MAEIGTGIKFSSFGCLRGGGGELVMGIELRDTCKNIFFSYPVIFHFSLKKLGHFHGKIGS